MSALETFLSDTAKIARTIEPIVSFIATVQAAVGIGGESATKAIGIVDGALKALEQYAAGHVTAEHAQASMAKLLDALAANDAAADAKLEERFR